MDFICEYSVLTFVFFFFNEYYWFMGVFYWTRVGFSSFVKYIQKFLIL